MFTWNPVAQDSFQKPSVNGGRKVTSEGERRGILLALFSFFTTGSDLVSGLWILVLLWCVVCEPGLVFFSFCCILFASSDNFQFSPGYTSGSGPVHRHGVLGPDVAVEAGG